MKILLAEDDRDLATRLSRALNREAFAVDWAQDGETALFLARTGSYDCVILDLGLPKIDGLAVLRQWREDGLNVPVLILTARYAWADKSAGFAAGADDYLTKPFLGQELIVRLRALIRRANGQKAGCVRCGPLTYDPISGAFTLGSETLRLTAFEARILTRLVQFPEAVVERDKLLDSIYEFEADVPNNSFEVLIGRLRRKIGHQMIETVRGQGYRLTAGIK
ncbi:response regulator transcription factor [Novosphingobium terrae]|uniref:response regulator transcription factor n=1 Tax=Novosphingobium terrae TaxID=2726189 RepID=UPI0019815CB4|nr:response regulator transcription factor [Novosphingobium terrae]